MEAPKERGRRQPPSGGCVLKLRTALLLLPIGQPAAFGRLRVETNHFLNKGLTHAPAAFGRLRVETVTFSFRF